VQHVSPNLVVRYVAGELSADEAAALQAHTAECAACRAQVGEQQALHAALGSWVVHPAEVDLTARIAGQLDGGSQMGRRSRINAVLRVAAAVLLGVGVGHEAGRWVPHSEGTPPVADGTPVAVPPDYELLSEPDVVGLWYTYDELGDTAAEDAS
jgi:anti-sigma factor RsiW